jgi:exopolysaccharide biosynthesis polyprenyl glycosylphosphotransferase
MFWLVDLISQGFAFAVAGLLVPFFQRFLWSAGLPFTTWIAAFSPAPLGQNFGTLSDYLWALVSMAPTTILCMEALGGYASIRKQSAARIIAISIIVPAVGVAILSTAFFVLKAPNYSRLFVLSFASISSVALCLTRLSALGYQRYRVRRGLCSEKIVLVGATRPVELLLRMFTQRPAEDEYEVIGCFSVQPWQAEPQFPDGRNLPLLGEVGELGDMLIQKPIQAVVLIPPNDDAGWLGAALQHCDYFRVPTYVLPEAVLMTELHDLKPRCKGALLNLPVVTLAPREMFSDMPLIKRILDISLSGALLLLSAPLMSAIALAIKLTTPRLHVLYRWKVVGLGGKPFTGYKFTTMVADADERKAALISRNEMKGPVFKMANDPRVTPLGRFLRKYSLDELPQLWSVLLGDMSLVGPRPAGPHELQRYDLWHKRKLSIKPGITCLWQIRGRNQIVDFDEWVRMDLEYIANWSLKLDFRILALTAWAVVRGTGC